MLQHGDGRRMLGKCSGGKRREEDGRGKCSTVWYGMAWYGMVWYGVLYYGVVWYGMVWYGSEMCCLAGVPQGSRKVPAREAASAIQMNTWSQEYFAPVIYIQYPYTYIYIYKYTIHTYT